MPIQIDQSGAFEVDYLGNYNGLNVQQPANIMPDTFSPSFDNVMLRHAQLASRPAFVHEFDGPDGAPILGLASFRDANGTFLGTLTRNPGLHTVCWTNNGMYQLLPVSAPSGQPSRQTSANPWVAVGGSAIAHGVPVSWGAFANVLYFTNGGALGAWDGIATTVIPDVATTAASVFPGAIAPVSVGGFFLAELDSHLLLANIVAADTVTSYAFPQRLWWSASGIPKETGTVPGNDAWDPSVNTSAGYNDFLDCPDNITGLATVGIQGYVFREAGITQFTPSGNGLLPFTFDHLWASNRGVGNVYPWSIAQYGPYLCFISIEQIYQIGINSFAPIGGMAREAILRDLAAATGRPTANIIGNFILSYSHFGYLISIPQAFGTRHYFFSLEDSRWEQWSTTNQKQTGRESEVWI